MKYIPKNPFTYILLAVVVYAYVTMPSSRAPEEPPLDDKLKIAVKPAEKEPGLTDKPVNYLMNKMAETDTGRAFLKAVVEESIKKDHGDKDVSLVVAEQKGQLMTMDEVKGEGPFAQCGSEVTIDYEAYTELGVKVDSSYDKKAPVTFTIGGNKRIKGLENGVIGMKVGGKRKIAVPSILAYSDPEFQNNFLPPKSPLLIEAEMLAVKDGAETGSAVMVIEDLHQGTSGDEVLCGKNVTINYTLTQEDGTILGGPLEFRVGSGNVLVGLERGVIGMRVGGSRKLTIPATLFGVRDKSLMPEKLVLPTAGPLWMTVDLGAVE